jgi:hypothetical protein
LLSGSSKAPSPVYQSRALQSLLVAATASLKVFVVLGALGPPRAPTIARFMPGDSWAAITSGCALATGLGVHICEVGAGWSDVVYLGTALS